MSWRHRAGGVPEQTRGMLQMLVPLQRAATPAEAAGGIAFLGSPSSDYVTGQVFSVSGGARLGTGVMGVHTFVAISVRDLRNHTAKVVAAVRAGERLSLTVNRTPVADIVPHASARNPWVPAETLRGI